MSFQKPLRVCHVAYSFYESDNRVIRYAETLAARGDHVDVLTLRRAGEAVRSDIKGVHVLGIQTRARNERAAWTYLLKILWFFVKCCFALSTRGLGKTYDVIHVHNIPDFLVFAAVVPKLRGTPIILDIHDLVPELYEGKFGTAERSLTFRSLLFLEGLSCRFADHVIVANHLWQDKLMQRSAPGRECTVLLNYPDRNVFHPFSERQGQLDARFVFLYPGTLNHHQGLDIAVEAFADACGRMPGAQLHVYGDGPSRLDLERLARARGVEARVRFMGRVPLTEVPALMRSADVGVVPKRADGFGNEAFSTKILEFMACQVPVIVSRTRIDAYYFGDDVVRFFTPGESADLARQMIWAYEHREELQQMAVAAERYVLDYSWQKHSTEYVAIVDALVCTREAPFVEAAGR